MTIARPLQLREQVLGQGRGAQTQSSRVAVQPGFLSYHAEKALTKENGISGETQLDRALPQDWVWAPHVLR